MSEPLTDRLSRFTPDATGLDRDALLFAAGRASARPNHGWATVAVALAACQLLTLVMLWPRSTPSGTVLATAHRAAEALPRPTPPPPDAAEPWSLHRLTREAEAGDLPPPSAADSLVPGDPPLHAFSSPPTAGID
jgi:hypothetical protein